MANLHRPRRRNWRQLLRGSPIYLRGLSTGDFRPALEGLLGEDAAGLSPTNIARLTTCWEKEYRPFASVTSRGASMYTSGWTACTSTSGSKTTGCAPW